VFTGSVDAAWMPRSSLNEFEARSRSFFRRVHKEQARFRTVENFDQSGSRAFNIERHADAVGLQDTQDVCDG
jgi:hypothetical protein